MTLGLSEQSLLHTVRFITRGRTLGTHWMRRRVDLDVMVKTILVIINKWIETGIKTWLGLDPASDATLKLVSSAWHANSHIMLASGGCVEFSVQRLRNHW